MKENAPILFRSMADLDEPRWWRGLQKPTDQQRSDFWFSRPLLWVLPLLVVGVVIISLYYPPAAGRWQPDEVSGYFARMTVSVDGKTMLDLNTADRQALQVLPGIGPTRAAAIIAYRQAHGPFASVEQLLQVDGIGEKTLQTLLEYVTVAH